MRPERKKERTKKKIIFVFVFISVRIGQFTINFFGFFFLNCTMIYYYSIINIDGQQNKKTADFVNSMPNTTAVAQLGNENKKFIWKRLFFWPMTNYDWIIIIIGVSTRKKNNKSSIGMNMERLKNEILWKWTNQVANKTVMLLLLWLWYDNVIKLWSTGHYFFFFHYLFQVFQVR